MKRALLFFLLVVLALLPLFLLAAYNHPTDDDFCTYQLFHDRSPWESLIYGYSSFSGRFTYLLIFAQWDPLYHTDWLLWTRIWPVITLLAFLITIRFIIRTTGLGGSGMDSWVLWGVISLALLTAWPSVASSFFWFTGATVYTLATLAAVFALIALHAATKAATLKHRAGLLLVALLLALIAVGSNEVLIAFLVLFTTTLLAWDWYLEKRADPLKLLFLVGLTLGAFVALSAPGNFKRATTMLHRSTDISYAVQVGVKCMYLVARNTGSWLLDVQLWLAGLLAATAVGNQRFSWLAPASRTQLGVLTLGGYLLLTSMAFLSCYAYNDIIPRIWNLLYFFFVFGFIFLLIHTSRYLPSLKPVFDLLRSNWHSFAIATVLACLLSGQSNLHAAWSDLLFKAHEYDLALTRRYAAFQKAKEDSPGEVVVPPIFLHRYQYPRTLFLNDLGLDPSRFPNDCIGHFFGLDGVKLSCCPPDSRHLE